MRSRNQAVRRSVAGVALVLGATSPLHALNIVLDYTHDTYIQTNATAQAALEAAAADLEAAITSVLPARTDVNSATVGKATATVDWSISYTNPATGTQITVDPATLNADEVRVFVGVRNITQPGDPTPTLGTGGPGAGISFGGSASIEPVFPNEIPQAIQDLGNAVAQMEAEANANASRGGMGPVLGTLNSAFSGSIGGQSYNFPFSIDYGVSVGNLWFDVDTDDNGSTDSNSTLDNYWHWNHTTSTPSGKQDFYSVALHELLHSLGFGTSDSWDNLIAAGDPDEWLGAELIAALGGSGENAIDVASGAHLAENLTGTVFGGTASQEAAMDPNITTGTRKLLTDLDVAVLKDIGWDVATITVGIDGDYNNDGSVDQGDLDLVLLNWGDDASATGVPAGWVNMQPTGLIGQTELDGVLLNWGNTAEAGGSAVPEPATLAVLGGIGLVATRRRTD